MQVGTAVTCCPHFRPEESDQGTVCAHVYPRTFISAFMLAPAQDFQHLCCPALPSLRLPLPYPQFLDLNARPGLLRTILEAQETRGLTRSDDISRLLPGEAALLARGRQVRSGAPWCGLGQEWQDIQSDAV